MLKRLLYIALPAALIATLWLGRTPVSHDIEWTGDLPASFSQELSHARPPIQQDFNGSLTPIRAGEFWLTPVAGFEIEARVLSRKNYRFGQEARLSPMDLAVGWGPMAQDDVLEHISIRQSGRFGYWSARDLPIPSREINHSFANIHIIPAGEEIAADLRQIGQDENIRLAGYLVNVHTDNGWRWDTSLTRTDTGPGACEILLVTRVAYL